jgi:hypothetical protein
MQFGSDMKKFLVPTIWVLVIVATAFVFDSPAQVTRIYDTRAVIGNRSKIKYIDLAKLVFPDAHVIKTHVAGFPNRKPTVEYRTEASSSIALSNGFGTYASLVLNQDMSINAIDSLRIYTQDGDRLLLMFSVSPIFYTKGAQVDENGDPIFNVSATSPDSEPEKRYVDVLAVFDVDKEPKLLDAIDVRKPEMVVSVELFAPLLVTARPTVS